MKILVIRISAMGDVAMLAAILREAATCYPTNDYTLLSAAKMEALMMAMPSNVHFLAHKDPIDWSEYDQVIDAHSVWRSWRLDLDARLHNIPIRRIHKPRWRRWLLVRHHASDIPSMITLYRRILNVVSPCPPPAYSGTRAHIGIAPFAAHRGKTYPLTYMRTVVRELGAYMLARGEMVLLFGAGEEETTLLNQWAEQLSGVTNIAGTKTLQEELETMKTLRLMVSMDSANAHLAALMGTRVISIWGATHPSAGFLAYGQDESDCIQRKLDCRPCSIYGNVPCDCGDYACMSIPPATVIQTILQAL